MSEHSFEGDPEPVRMSDAEADAVRSGATGDPGDLESGQAADSEPVPVGAEDAAEDARSSGADPESAAGRA